MITQSFNRKKKIRKNKFEDLAFKELDSIPQDNLYNYYDRHCPDFEFED